MDKGGLAIQESVEPQRHTAPVATEEGKPIISEAFKDQSSEALQIRQEAELILEDTADTLDAVEPDTELQQPQSEPE